MTDLFLGARELDVMGVLWSLGSGTVSEVKQRLSAPLAYTTVLTILRNLESKGVISHAVEGKSHRYVPRLTEQEARKKAVKHTLEKYFGNDAEELVLHLVRDGSLSRKDLKRLRRILRNEGSGDRQPLKRIKRDPIPVYRQDRKPGAAGKEKQGE